MYKENPKTVGSGIIAAIPQTGRCPNGCEDCFFQSGRSYLEPLNDNLPNMPTIEQSENRIVRVNDGNDSNVSPEYVIDETNKYKNRFFNTAIPFCLDRFPEPVVLTLNPGKDTDTKYCVLPSTPKNLMFVRMRVNTWNLTVVDEAVKYYTEQKVPVILTFMAYYNDIIPEEHKTNYIFRKRTINSYYAITTAAWEIVMQRYKYNPYVYSCGKIEGEKGTTKCERCGNCIREFYVTKERMLKQ